jgi:alpha-L-arabinofuranosidase
MKSIKRALAFFALLLCSGACEHSSLAATEIAINKPTVVVRAKRLGMNLGENNYWDSLQLLKNLTMNNPGFEGEIYQSTIRCASGTQTTCVDDDQWSAWPTGFWNGATFEVFYGAAAGQTGTISSYTAAVKPSGGTFTFSGAGTAPAAGDYMIVRMTVPGGATEGWWPTTSGAGAIATNTADLPPGTTGKQTAALSAPGAGDKAELASYFDSTTGVPLSFVQLNGTYQLSFKAKGTGGTNSIGVSVSRLVANGTYLSKTVSLTGVWANYTVTFNAAENGNSAGQAVAVKFDTVGQDSFLLDDVSLAQVNGDPTNQTAFRDPVVNTLKALNPGSLRFWGGQLGNTLDNLLADQYGRKPAGFSAFSSQAPNITYSLPEFLQLCAAIGAEPWFVVPTTFSTTEASNLIEYLSGSSTTPYGQKRVAGGQTTPWTQVFSKIHLEFGNEAWNSTFKGGSIEYPQPYGNRAQAIFAAMRADAFYNPASFDLILGGQEVSPGNNTAIQNNCNNNDSFTVASYMMGTVNTFDTNENLFGSTFAEAEVFNSATGSGEGLSGPGGVIYQNLQALKASSHPVPLTVYESNMGTMAGSITQTAANQYLPSLGAGLAVADNMLQSMRLGVTTQNFFQLGQYWFSVNGLHPRIWGAVIDMGGNTNRQRPSFLALKLANQAIGTGAIMLQTVHSGADPTWNQAMVNGVQLDAAHYLQSFAFSNGTDSSVIVFNLHRSASLPVTFTGAFAPAGRVQIHQLTSANITDTNEIENNAIVTIADSALAFFNPASGLSLPPFSMTVITWRSLRHPEI